MIAIERVCWLVLALIHLKPAIALFRPRDLAQMYALDPQGPKFALLHHRAVLFVIVVIACLSGAIDPGSRRLAAFAVGASMLSFLAIYAAAAFPAGLKSIARADLAGLPFLGVVLWRVWFG